MSTLQDKVVVITGWTKGIGLATAKKFLADGCHVLVLGRHDEPYKLSELAGIGDVTFVKADVSNVNDCRTSIDTAVQKYGKVDILINVAGVVGRRGSFTELDLSDVQNTIQINLMGTIAMSQFAAKNMLKNRSGVIINIGSIDGFMANTESIGYHASKGGVKMITQAMARELSPYGIRVVSVAPGWVRTGMIDKDIEEVGSKLHMKGRIILPEEIANAVYLMCLPEASAINGSTVMADDGYASFKGVDGFQAE